MGKSKTRSAKTGREKIGGGITGKMNMKRAVKLCLMACILALIPIGTIKAAPAPKLSKTSLTVTVGTTKTLKVKNAKDKVKWSSSNIKVAKVTSKGVVKGIKAGTAKIRAKVSKKTLTCTVKVKNANATAESVKFANATGGDFVRGVSNATISFVLTNASTDVKVRVLNTLGNAVYTRTYAKCKANKVNSFAWNGKNSKGKYVGEGMYRVCITAGSKKTYSKTLKLYPKEFAAGDGSKSNPYQVKTLAHLRNVNKYNGRHFRQVANIDGDDANFSPLFTGEEPFVGIYDGRNYTVSRLYFRKTGLTGLFSSIGKEGTVQNVKVKNFTIINGGAGNAGGIAANNYGKILNCTATDVTIDNNFHSSCGGICGHNGGLVQSSKAESVVIKSPRNAGGIAGYVEEGQIVDCNSHAVQIEGQLAGGIVGMGVRGSIIRVSSTTGDCSLAGWCGAIVGRKDYDVTVEGCWTDTEYPLYREN